MTKVVVLAAGQGFKLDNFNKLLLKHPETKRTILESYIDKFGKDNLIVGIGYRGISVVHEYPELNYVINNRWSETSSAETLRMCIDEINEEKDPIIILPGDAFVESEALNELKNSSFNTVFVESSEKIKPNSVMCEVEKNRIKKIYQGKPKANDYNLVGCYKFESISLVKKMFGSSNKIEKLFVSEVLMNYINNFGNEFGFPIFDATNTFTEIETVEDYLRYKMRIL